MPNPFAPRVAPAPVWPPQLGRTDPRTQVTAEVLPDSVQAHLAEIAAGRAGRPLSSPYPTPAAEVAGTRPATRVMPAKPATGKTPYLSAAPLPPPTSPDAPKYLVGDLLVILLDGTIRVVSPAVFAREFDEDA